MNFVLNKDYLIIRLHWNLQRVSLANNIIKNSVYMWSVEKFSTQMWSGEVKRLGTPDLQIIIIKLQNQNS